MNKKLSFIIALILSFLQIFNVYALTPTDAAKQDAMALELDAASAILMDAQTGEVLYQKSAEERKFPASITKLMTVLLVLENTELTDTVLFSYAATHSIEFGSSHIGIDTDEQLTIEQCLYAIMLQSANEVSNGVAEHIAGSMEEFSEMMTTRAQELGCTGTNFANAHGLHDENHYTTAKDMALIAKELLKFPFFTELMGTLQYNIPATNKQPETRYLYAQNQLIKNSSIFYNEKVLGGKTGFTSEAGNTLVSYAQDGDTLLISVVLQSTGYGLYTDSNALFDYGFKHFQTSTVAKSGESPVSISVTETMKKQTLNLGLLNLIYPEDIVVTLPKGTAVTAVTPTYKISEKYEAPIREGDEITKVDFMLGDELIASSMLVADKTILASSAESGGRTNEASKAPISPVIVFSLLLLAVAALIAVRIVISKIEYEKRKKRRSQRLQKLRDTYGEIPRGR